MIFNRFFLIFFLAFALFYCNPSFSQNFNKTQIKSLFDAFNKQSQTTFSYKVLENFLKDVNIENIKKGNVFEKEVLFENFECDCKDRMKISFDKSTKVFIIQIYEASFVKDLDWSPEHSYIGSFKIIDDRIENTKFNLIAG
jgi:hypothetical protein